MDFRDMFTARMDNDGVIYNISGREPVRWGIGLHVEQELRSQIADQDEVLSQYYNKLVELGVIVPEKTPEEIAKEAAEQQLQLIKEQNAQQSALILKQTEIMSAMMQKLEEIGGVKNGITGHSNGSSGVEVGENSEQNRQVSKRGKSGTKSGTENSIKQ